MPIARDRTGRTRQACLDRADDPRLHRLVAARPRVPGLHDLERTHGMRRYGTDRWQSQDGAHAGENGPHARAHGRLAASGRPRAATAPSTNIAPRRCAGSRTSSASSGISSTGCAWPRTRPSSTSSWPIAATGTASPAPQPAAKLSLRKRPPQHCGGRFGAAASRKDGRLVVFEPGHDAGTRSKRSRVTHP